MQNPSPSKATCTSCGKDFNWSVDGDHYQGNKMTEFIECPYCDARNGSIRTSGFVYSSKID